MSPTAYQSETAYTSAPLGYVTDGASYVTGSQATGDVPQRGKGEAHVAGIHPKTKGQYPRFQGNRTWCKNGNNLNLASLKKTESLQSFCKENEKMEKPRKSGV